MKSKIQFMAMVLLGILLSINQVWGASGDVMNSFNAISGDYDTNISFAAAKGSANTAPAVNSNEIRVYQGGGTFTVTAKNGVTITEIVLGSSMATTVTYAIDGGSASSNKSIAAGKTMTTGTISASDKVLFTCKGTDKNSRLYVNYLKVTYSSSGGATKTTVTLNANGKGSSGELTITKGNRGPDDGKRLATPTGGTGWVCNGYTTASNNAVYILKANGGPIASTAYADYTGAWTSSDKTLTLFAQWDATAISAPAPTSLSVSGVSATGATLNWGAVTGAASYTVYITDADSYEETFSNITETTSKTISGLTAGTDYYWTVTAIANTANGYTGNPESTTKNFTTTSSTSYTITWKVAGATYTSGSPTTSVPSGGKVSTLPTAPADNTLNSCGATKFMGWSTHNLGSDSGQAEPGDLFTDAEHSPEITDNTTFYAVFATAQ